MHEYTGISGTHIVTETRRMARSNVASATLRNGEAPFWANSDVADVAAVTSAMLSYQGLGSYQYGVLLQLLCLEGNLLLGSSQMWQSLGCWPPPSLHLLIGTGISFARGATQARRQLQQAAPSISVTCTPESTSASPHLLRGIGI